MEIVKWNSRSYCFDLSGLIVQKECTFWQNGSCHRICTAYFHLRWETKGAFTEVVRWNFECGWVVGFLQKICKVVSTLSNCLLWLPSTMTVISYCNKTVDTDIVLFYFEIWMYIRSILALSWKIEVQWLVTILSACNPLRFELSEFIKAFVVSYRILLCAWLRPRKKPVKFFSLHFSKQFLSQIRCDGPFMFYLVKYAWDSASSTYQ